MSEVVPSLREAKPTPPPWASPPTATVGHEPAGIVVPARARRSYTSISLAPGPTDAVRAARSTEIPASEPRSTTRPSSTVEYPA